MPVVPRPPTSGPGIPSTSALNQIRDAVRFLQSPPIAELRQTSAQSIPNSTWTALTFGVEDVDTDIDGTGGHSTSVNTARFTARYPGWYALGGSASIVFSAAGVRGAKWQVNGIDLNGGQQLLATNPSFSNIIPARSIKHVFLTDGDFVELLAFQSSGGALNTSVAPGAEQSNMSVRWVSL